MKLMAIVLGFFAAACVCGCRIERQPAPPATFLTLHGQPAPSAIEALQGACLRVRPVTAQAPYTGLALLYRTGDLTFEKDYYSHFLTPPDQQVGDALAQWLQSGGLALCTDGLDGQPHRYILEPHLEAFYADFRTPAAPSAFVRCRFVLTRYDRSCRCSSIRLDQTFEAAVRLYPKPNAEAVAAGLSRALDAVLLQFHSALQTLQ